MLMCASQAFKAVVKEGRKGGRKEGRKEGRQAGRQEGGHATWLTQ